MKLERIIHSIDSENGQINIDFILSSILLPPFSLIWLTWRNQECPRLSSRLFRLVISVSCHTILPFYSNLHVRMIMISASLITLKFEPMCSMTSDNQSSHILFVVNIRCSSRFVQAHSSLWWIDHVCRSSFSIGERSETTISRESTSWKWGSIQGTLFINWFYF